MDYLSKERVIELFKNADGYKDYLNSIESEAPAKVEERKEAVWWEVSDDPLDPRLRCSNCEKIHMPQGDETRCPHCGAYMIFDNRISIW